MRAVKRVGRRRLLLRVLRYRQLPALVLVAVACLVGAGVSGAATIRDSARLALVQSTAAGLGGKAYAVTADTDRAGQLLAADSRFLPIADREGEVVTAGARLPVGVRVTAADPSPELGWVVTGRHPRAAGEVVLSARVAGALGVGIGGRVEVSWPGASTPAVVVGTSTDPGNAGAAMAVVAVDELAARDATMWVSDIDPYGVPALRPALDAQTMKYRSRSGLEDASRDRLPPAAASLAYLPLGLGALLVMVLGGVITSLLRIARRDHGAMVAAGMASREAYRVLVNAAIGLVVAGIVVGAALIDLAIWMARGQVSQRFGQNWVAIAPSWWPVLVLLGLALVARVAAASAYRFLRSWTRRTAAASATRLVPGRFSALLGIAAVVLLVIAGVSRVPTPPHPLIALAPYGVVAGTAWMAIQAPRLAVQRATPAVASLVTTLTARLVVVALAAGVLAVAGATFAARVTHNANAFDALTPSTQPRGSLLLSNVSSTSASEIVAAYTAWGGQDARRYRLPDESTKLLRVTGPGLIECMHRAGTTDPNDVAERCFPQETMSPVGFVAFADGDLDTAVADPGLVVDNRVGLMTFEGGTGKATYLGLGPARAQEGLGANLPGLVLPLDDPLARQLGIEPGASEEIALLGFTALPESRRAQLRALIARLAPTTEVLDASNDQPYAVDRAVAAGAALVTSALVLLVTLVGGASVVAAHRRSRRTLADIGTTTRRCAAIAGRWSAVLILTFTTTLVLSWLGAQLAGINAAGSSGLLWMLPSACGLAAAVALLLGFIRVPPRVGE